MPPVHFAVHNMTWPYVDAQKAGFCKPGTWDCEPNTLDRIASFFCACSWLLQVFTVKGAKSALAPGGVLEQMLAEGTLVSAAEARSIERWRHGLGFWPCLILVLMMAGAMGAETGSDSIERIGPSDVTDAQTAIWFAYRFTILWVFNFLTLFHQGRSMRVGCAIARVRIAVVIKNVDDCNPIDDESFERTVVAPVLKLQTTTMRTLSMGCELVGWLWMASLCKITPVINPAHTAGVARMTVVPYDPVAQVTPVPVLLAFSLLQAQDVASTSSQCDRLIYSLIACRLRRGKASHANIRSLELGMRQLNEGGGLSFVCLGIVVDKRWLWMLALSLGGGLSTLVGALLALGKGDVAALGVGAGACALTAQEEGSIRAAMGSRSPAVPIT